MAVLVKPNGLLGTAYMAAIKPFRQLIVYPMREPDWERPKSAGTKETRRKERTHESQSPVDARGGTVGRPRLGSARPQR